MELWNKYKTKLKLSKINTALRLSHFFSQLEHESNLKPISEDTNYSRKTLLTVFKKYFNEKNVDEYLGKGDKILDKVYANRMGNGNEASKDGSRYKGRGFIQITGKDNYIKASKALGVDYVNNPDLALNEADAMLIAIWYWNVNNINKYADIDDLDGVSDMINIGRKTEAYGDSNGFAHRKSLYLKKYKEIFKDW